MSITTSFGNDLVDTKGLNVLFTIYLYIYNHKMQIYPLNYHHIYLLMFKPKFLVCSKHRCTGLDIPIQLMETVFLSK